MVIRTHDLASLIRSAQEVGLLRVYGDREALTGVNVRGIRFDSRTLRPEELYVAVRGTHTDGHRYIDAALQQGACAVVVDNPSVWADLAPRAPVPVLLVEDARRALAHLAGAFFEHPARSLGVVGVTGTVGKTSTALMLRQLLGRAGMPAAAIGSLGMFCDHVWRPSPLTTPDPVQLNAWLREAVDAGTRYAVVEVSSHALAQRRIDGMSLALGVLTRLVPGEHLDYHGTYEAYLATKRRFLDYLGPEARLVYNAVDPDVVRLASAWPLRRRVAFALDPAPTWRAPGVPVLVGRCTSISLSGTEVELTAPAGATWPQGGGPAPGERVKLGLRLLGRHAAFNAVGSMAAALALGVPWDVVKQAASELRPLRRRMEILYRGAFTVLDDTTGHPESYAHLLQTLAAAEVPSAVLVVAVRGSRGEHINRLNGEAIAAWAAQVGGGRLRQVIVTDSAEYAGERDRVKPEERRGLLDALSRGGVAVSFHAGLDAAVTAALEVVQPGEVLVLSGAQGMDRGADVVRRLLGAGAAQVGTATPTTGAPTTATAATMASRLRRAGRVRDRI